MKTAKELMLGYINGTAEQSEGWLRLFGQISLRDKWICLSG
jgi:hypothetical protein